MFIAIAGNVEAPLYSLIIEKGYSIEVKNSYWIAKHLTREMEFRGENIIDLAALILLGEVKGSNWKVSDSKIDEYLDFLKQNNQF